MDYVLDIIIPRQEIQTVNLNEKLIEWGDNVYSCEPPLYETDTNIIFEKIEDIQYFNKVIGKELKDDTIVLHLKSDIFFDLQYDLNNSDAMLEKNILFDFLTKLIKLSEFYILMVREDETVKECYSISTKEEISIRLSDSLKWTNPKDILLFKKVCK